ILGRQGSKVILVDSDMRSPSLHERLELNNDKGLSSVLSGNLRWEDAVQDSVKNGFKVITAGPHPPNAADLLSGPGVKALWNDLGKVFDHVIVDAPPMLGLAD